MFFIYLINKFNILCKTRAPNLDVTLFQICHYRS